MGSHRITEQFIRSLGRVPRRRLISDQQLQGFYLDARESGRHRYIIRYVFRGLPKSLVIGRVDLMKLWEARKLAYEALGKAHRGEDPAVERQTKRKIPTFSSLANEWLELKSSKVSIGDDKAKLEAELVPSWGNRHVDGISTIDVKRELDRIRDERKLADATVNRYRSLICALFNYAKDEGYISENPVNKQLKPLPENNERQRYLSEAEAVRLEEALQSEPQNAANAIRMMLLTGQRRSNVQSMCWSDIDREHNIWTIRKTKQQKIQHVPLVPAAVEILDRQATTRRMDNPYVFPGRDTGTHLQSVQRIWESAIRKAKLKEIRLHDLRHSFASFVGMSGGSLLVIGRLLGHSDPKVTQRYAHLADEYLRGFANAAAEKAVSTGNNEAADNV